VNTLLALETATRRAIHTAAQFSAARWTNAGEHSRREMEAAQEALRLARNAFEQELRQKCDREATQQQGGAA
jgi:hypothetical protein